MRKYLDQDPFTKITKIFCAESDKPSNPQRQVVDEEILPSTNDSKRTNQTDSTNQRMSEPVEEGKRILKKNHLCFIVFR